MNTKQHQLLKNWAKEKISPVDFAKAEPYISYQTNVSALNVEMWINSGDKLFSVRGYL
jgi:hypothetical protein